MRDWKIPIPPEISAYGSVSSAMYAQQMMYDSIRYNARTMGYETESQSRRIRDLESQLATKETKRQNDLQSIIGYFYKR